MNTTVAPQTKKGRKRQYTDQDLELIRAGELSNQMIHEITGTSLKVLSTRRWIEEKKLQNEKPWQKRKYTKRVKEPTSTEKPNKSVKYVINGTELIFGKSVKRINIGDNCVNIEL